MFYSCRTYSSTGYSGDFSCDYGSFSYRIYRQGKRYGTYNNLEQKTHESLVHGMNAKCYNIVF